MFNSEYDILTVPEMMEELQIGHNYAYQLLKTNQIKAYRIGRSWRIPRISLTQYIQCSIKNESLQHKI